MAYTRIIWQDGPSGGTPLSAANLNHMDQGIADAHAGVDALDPATRLQVSGSVTAEIEIGLGASKRLQSVPVTIPAGKSLVLKRVRAYLDFDEQTVAMAWISASPGTGWQSDSGRPLSINGSPNAVLRENSSGDSEDVLVAFYVIASIDPFTLKVGSGWWLDLAIE